MGFAHHQKSFNEYFYPNCVTKMSSCGLIYKHFGKQFLKKIANDNNLEYTDKRSAISDRKITDTIYYKMYKCSILEIDANDNGVFINNNGYLPTYIMYDHHQ